MDLSGFDRLEEEAVEYALKLIKAAYDYRAGRIDEIALSDMIGNRTYSGGKEGQNYY